ncbi:hypothetical protein Pdw03_5345 [Penicillium digitatum]|uniref:CCHC-type domain-containing protein n=1 Tax=Penicillium digitatum TaxID=36651 RepID=A0A7T6XUV6_PENDI|nr:hypothetical protein Pdw03_5345 [Penicillium digitatum]
MSEPAPQPPFLPSDLEQFAEHARDHPDQWFEYCRRAYDYIESTQSEATNARERVDQAELQLQAARIKITRLSSELTAAERDHLRDVAVLEYQKKLYDEAQQNIARIEAARMCAAELAIPTGNTVPPPVPEPAAEPGVAAAMGTPPSLTPESSGSHRLAMEGEMHNEALPTMLEQAINREMKGMLLHDEPPKGDYLDLARFLQNLENRRVQYDSGPSTAPRTYSAAIRTAPKAPELNSGRPGPEQAATTPPVNPDAMELSTTRRRFSPYRQPSSHYEQNACFRCGSKEHFVRDCPQADKRPLAARQMNILPRSPSPISSPRGRLTRPRSLSLEDSLKGVSLA